MNVRSQPKRYALHLLLAAALLLLGWLQLAHELDLHAHDSGEPCEICLFTGHIGQGAPATPLVFVVFHPADLYCPVLYVAPWVASYRAHGVSPRGPPRFSIA